MRLVEFKMATGGKILVRPSAICAFYEYSTPQGAKFAALIIAGSTDHVFVDAGLDDVEDAIDEEEKKHGGETD